MLLFGGSPNDFLPTSHESQTPARPKVGGFPGFGPRFNYNEAVVPHTKKLGTVSASFTFTMTENSVGIIRLIPTNHK